MSIYNLTQENRSVIYQELIKKSFEILSTVSITRAEVRIWNNCIPNLLHSSSHKASIELYNRANTLKDEYTKHKELILLHVQELQTIIDEKYLSDTLVPIEENELNNTTKEDEFSNTTSVLEEISELSNIQNMLLALKQVVFSYEDHDAKGFTHSIQELTATLQTRSNASFVKTKDDPNLFKYTQLIVEAQHHYNQYLASLQVVTSATMTMKLLTHLIVNNHRSSIEEHYLTQVSEEQETISQNYAKYKSAYTYLSRQFLTTMGKLEQTSKEPKSESCNYYDNTQCLIKDLNLRIDALFHRYTICMEGTSSWTGTHLNFLEASKAFTQVYRNSPAPSSSTFSWWNPLKWLSTTPTREESLEIINRLLWDCSSMPYNPVQRNLIEKLEQDLHFKQQFEQLVDKIRHQATDIVFPQLEPTKTLSDEDLLKRALQVLERCQRTHLEFKTINSENEAQLFQSITDLNSLIKNTAKFSF